jgi:hypothetical protein
MQRWGSGGIAKVGRKQKIMAKRSKLVINSRVYESLKCLIKEGVFVEVFVDSVSRSFSRGIIIEGQRILSSTVETLINWDVLEFKDGLPSLTNRGRHMLETGEGLRVENKK